MHTLSREFSLEAAHLLPNVPAGHKCRRLHGHSFAITIEVRGEVREPEGWVLDFAEIDRAFEPLRERLDHRYLNEIEGLENPTSENLARWIWERLRGDLPELCGIEVAETCQARCRYGGLADGGRGN